MKDSLLQQLADDSHCFISDLVREDMRGQIIFLLERYNLAYYGVQECSYTLSYILGKEISLERTEDMTIYLKTGIW